MFCKKLVNLFRFYDFDIYIFEICNLPSVSVNRFGDEVNVIFPMLFCRFANVCNVASAKCRKLEICDYYALFKQNIA